MGCRDVLVPKRAGEGSGWCEYLGVGDLGVVSGGGVVGWGGGGGCVWPAGVPSFHVPSH